MNRHLEADWAILTDRYDLPEYIRFADVTWLGNHLSRKVLRRLQDVDRYEFLDTSDKIPDRELRKAIEKACLISRKAHTYAQYKFGAMVHPSWLEKEKFLLSETKIGYYFPGVIGQDRLILGDRALQCRDYCAKIVRFLSDILEVEMFLRDHSNRENTSLFIRMTTELSKAVEDEIDTYDNADDIRMRHRDLLIQSTPLFYWMYSDYEHDVAVIW